ncbi:hypothetical protein SK128_017768, partial [Halocaridina rubra]
GMLIGVDNNVILCNERHQNMDRRTRENGMNNSHKTYKKRRRLCKNCDNSVYTPKICKYCKSKNKNI